MYSIRELLTMRITTFNETIRYHPEFITFDNHSIIQRMRTKHYITDNAIATEVLVGLEMIKEIDNYAGKKVRKDET